MFRSKLIVPALSVMCLLASQAVVPSLAMASSPLRAIVAAAPVPGAKMVHLNLCNNTTTSLDMKVGDTPVTLAVGETVQLSAPAGAKITLLTAVTTHEAGSIVAEVSKDMSGATIHVN
jgi:hypothetical protein